MRTYEDKDKKTVWVTEVIGDRIEFIERKSDNTAGAAADEKAKNAFTGMGQEVPFDTEVPF